MTAEKSPAASTDKAGASGDDPGPSPRPAEDKGFLTLLRRRFKRLSRKRESEPGSDAKDGASTVQQQTLLENVRRMGALRVSDAMVPRADVVGVELGVSLEAAQEAFRDCGHSRLPVFVETLD